MFFDPKTRRFYGKLGFLTDKQRDFYNKQVKKGIMVSTEHPSQEEIDAVLDWQSTHGFNEGIEDLLKERDRRD